MRSIQKKSRIKRNLLISALAMLILCGVAYILFTFNHSSTSESNYDNVEPAPATLSDEDAKNKEKFINEDSNPKPNQNIPSSDNQISAKVENGELTVTSKLYSISDGECALEVKKGTKEITRTAQVIYQPSYSTCAGFSIDTSEFSMGSWDVTLTIKSAKGTEDVLRTAVDINS